MARALLSLVLFAGVAHAGDLVPLTGRILRLDLTPAPGVRVIAVPRGETAPAETRTDEAGRFRFADLPTGPVSIHIGDDDGIPPVKLDTVWLPGVRHVDLIDPDSGEPVTGQVVDLDGAPIEGARVEFKYYGDAFGESVTVARLTDAAGAYTIRRASHYGGTRRAGWKQVWESGCDVVMARAVVIQGTVRGPAGSISGASVAVGKVTTHRGESYFHVESSVVTDEKGQFDIEVTPGRTAVFRTSAEGFATVERTIEDVGKTAYLLFDLKKRRAPGPKAPSPPSPSKPDAEPDAESKHTLTGRVVDETGAPVAGAFVRLTRVWGNSKYRFGSRLAPRHSRSTSADGAFRMDDLPPGPWGLWAWAPEHQQMRPVVVEKPTSARVEIVVHRFRPLEGFVRTADGPAVGVVVRLGEMPWYRGDIRWFTRTDGKGHFRFAAAPPRRNRLEILGDAAATTNVAARYGGYFKPGDSIVVEVALAGVIEGRVVRDDGKPAPFASVSIGLDGENGVHVSADAKGRFCAVGVPLKPTRLTAGWAGAEGPRIAVGVATVARASAATVELRLGARSTIAGRILLPTGAPDRHDDLTLEIVGDGPPVAIAKARTDERGRFEFTSIPIGAARYRIRSTRAEYKHAPMRLVGCDEIRAGAIDLTIRMAKR